MQRDPFKPCSVAGNVEPADLHQIVVVRRSPIHGRGLYARLGIPRGTHIGTYEGRSTRRDGRYVLWLIGDGDDQGRLGLNHLRYLNHSDRPNARFEDFDLFATEDIPEDGEITFDYDAP